MLPRGEIQWISGKERRNSVKKRPKSVTVISWLYIVLGGLSVITSLATLNNSMLLDWMHAGLLPVEVQIAWSIISMLLVVVASIAMLNGQNWGRFLFVVVGVIGILVSFLRPIEARAFLGSIWFAMIFYFLFRADANEYFANRVYSSSQPPNATM